jgi:hypothetical protein
LQHFPIATFDALYLTISAASVVKLALGHGIFRKFVDNFKAVIGSEIQLSRSHPQVDLGISSESEEMARGSIHKIHASSINVFISLTNEQIIWD